MRCGVGATDFSDVVPLETDPAPGSLESQLTIVNDMLTTHGGVTGTTGYEERHQARWRARRLIKLLAASGLRPRWMLRERTWRDENGRWRWAVDLQGGQSG